MPMIFTIDSTDAIRAMRAYGHDLSDAGPVLRDGLSDYQVMVARTSRPTVLENGNFFGEQWLKLKPQYKRQDGTVVEVTGGVQRARGRGTVQGKIKSSAVGRGRGSRYKAGDRQLGDRAGGLWSRWITDMPTIVSKVEAVLVSTFRYAKINFTRRPPFTAETNRRTAAFMADRWKQHAEAAARARGID